MKFSIEEILEKIKLGDDVCSDEVRQLENEFKRLNKALEFYAPAEKYAVKHWLDNDVEIRKDSGEKARQALEQTK